MADLYDRYIYPAGTVVDLRDDDVATTRTELGVPPTTDLVVGLCPACARLRLVSSTPGGTGTTAAAIAATLCNPCQTFRTANTTLFDQIVRMERGQRFIHTSVRR